MFVTAFDRASFGALFYPVALPRDTMRLELERKQRYSERRHVVYYALSGIFPGFRPEGLSLLSLATRIFLPA